MISSTLIEQIRNHNVISLGPGNGTKIVIGDDIILTWKAEGADTGYAFSSYEVQLAPNRGIPIHYHPYAEFFYVVEGLVDFQKCNESGELEWMSCGPGHSVVAPPNAPHAFFNSSEAWCKFVATSTYHHELMLKRSETPDGVLSEGYRNPTPEGFQALMRSQARDQVFYLEKDI